MTHGWSVPTAFGTCANEAVIDGSVQLEDYETVVWVLGDESSSDETFSASRAGAGRRIPELRGETDRQRIGNRL